MSDDGKRWVQLGLAVIGAGYVIGATIAAAIGSVLVFAEWAAADEIDLD